MPPDQSSSEAPVPGKSSGTAFPTEPEFKTLREATVLPDLHGVWSASCQFIMDATKRDHAWFHMYRADPDHYPIEKDLEDGLWAINRDDNLLRWHHLRHLRRFYFQRYAFGRARMVNRILYENEQAPWLWLYKDVVLLRVALALLLGYALVFGAGNTSLALRLLAHQPGWEWILPPLSIVLLDGLIYINARLQAGRVKGLAWRAVWVSLGTAMWAAAYCVAAKQLFGVIGWCWYWSEAVLVSAAAAPLSILAQFFFGSDRSLTDPL